MGLLLGMVWFALGIMALMWKAAWLSVKLSWWILKATARLIVWTDKRLEPPNAVPAPANQKRLAPPRGRNQDKP